MASLAARFVPRRPGCRLRCGRGWPSRQASRREIRTGFFPEDPDFIDPEGPLLADRVGSRWRYMDDPSLQASVLERSNVGMGMVVLNQARGLDLPQVNSLYGRLRNLEVNSLKRFVGLTAFDPGPFCVGLDPQELLLAATAAQRHGNLPRFSRALLWHSQELAHLVADYRKPVVCQLSGLAAGSGAALGCLASFSGAHEESEVAFDFCAAGLAPTGGASHVLAALPWHLGEFLALTGLPVRGADLVYTGLVRHWLSPDALPFLELTAEKQLEVSETDARALLDEHSLPLPDGLGPGDSLPKEWIPLVARAFSRGDGKSAATGVPAILQELRALAREPESRQFAELCLGRMEAASPLAAHVALLLVRRARDLQARAKAEMRADPHYDDQHAALGTLVETLRLELRAAQRLLCSQDALVGLARRFGQGDKPWSRQNLGDVTWEEVCDVVAPPSSEAGEAADFAVHERSEISLSAHPRLRRYHPEYDPATKLDHDPAWMAAEVRRWDPSLFADERAHCIAQLLGPGDPADFGQARYVSGVASG